LRFLLGQAFGDDIQADRGKQEKILSMAVYLEDSDRENGCFRVVPGSVRVLIFQQAFSSQSRISVRSVF
jgi:ectoine hydroxylase-related dioxygenase (phytanoyl-CoA dioxygenase family)